MRKQRDKKNKGRVINVGLKAGYLFLGILFLFALSGCFRKTVNMNDYITVEFEGYNGYGDAIITFDRDDFLYKYDDVIRYNGTNQMTSTRIAVGETPASIFLNDAFDLEVSKVRDLANDETITLTWKVNSAFAEDFNVKYKCPDMTVKVEGLQEVKTFDAFEGIEVSFQGISPRGMAYLEQKNSNVDYDKFSFDKSTGLKNGDIVTVSLDDSNLKYYLEENGAIPAEFSKTYTVSGLEYFITDTSELSGDIRKQLGERADAIVLSQCAKWSKETYLDGADRIGNYFLTAIGNEEEDQNRYGFVYVINSHISPGKDYPTKSVTCYYAIAFKNIILDENNQLDVNAVEYYTSGGVVEVSIDQSGWGSWMSKDYFYEGYSTLDQLKNAHYNCYLDRYIAQWDVNDI